MALQHPLAQQAGGCQLLGCCQTRFYVTRELLLRLSPPSQDRSGSVFQPPGRSSTGCGCVCLDAGTSAPDHCRTRPGLRVPASADASHDSAVNTSYAPAAAVVRATCPLHGCMHARTECKPANARVLQAHLSRQCLPVLRPGAQAPACWNLCYWSLAASSSPLWLPQRACWDAP